MASGLLRDTHHQLMDRTRARGQEPRRCHVYFFDGWIGVAPTVVGLAQMLAVDGYQVTIYCPRTVNTEVGRLGEGVEIRYVGVPKFLQRVPGVARLSKFIGCLFAARRSRGGKPGIHVGVDGTGALLASLAARRDGGVTVHLSLEIDTRTGAWHGLWRALFRAAYARTICCVVQDRERFAALSAAVQHLHSLPFFIPNGPMGGAAPQEGPNYFRQKLSISDREFPILVVHAGIIDDVVYSRELAEAFNGVEADCALVFHERAARHSDEPYLVQIRRLNRRNLFLSLDPVPFESIDRVFSAATIGLAFYRPIDANLALIAKASGKMAFHLKHGTPMIMNDLPSMVELNERYQFGVTVRDPASSVEMGSAVEYCLQNYERLCANARRCFEQEFQLETKAQSFRQFIATNFPP